MKRTPFKPTNGATINVDNLFDYKRIVLGPHAISWSRIDPYLSAAMVDEVSVGFDSKDDSKQFTVIYTGPRDEEMYEKHKEEIEYYDECERNNQRQEARGESEWLDDRHQRKILRDAILRRY